jgi:dolichyl-diphosphooligosaccharide--protein glycosyltransferase
MLLLLAPAACLLSAIGLSPTITTYMQHIRSGTGHGSSRKKSDIASKFEVAVLITATIVVFLVLYVLHCTWVTSEAYSSPSIVLQAKGPAGDR